MRFTTLTFLLFFLIFYTLYWVMRGRQRFYLVVLSSFIFYAAWSVGFALHFLAVVLINYVLIYFLHEKRSRGLLALIVSANLLNLFFFKYTYFLVKILFDLSGSTTFTSASLNGWLSSHTGFDEIVLPLAISFYSFQLIAYAVDTYRGIIPERAPFLDFMVFTLFFPHFVAGPIMRHSDFVPQLKDIQPNRDKMIEGMFLLLTGLVKKVVVADNAGQAIADVFARPGSYDGASNIIAAVGYCVRVYCDFSGYTDIARALAKLMGLELPENFRAPFLARSVRELWQRWHITLAAFLRDYIYIPLGGSRRGEIRNHLNVVITFTLGGVWHGANYTYLAWGLFHGIIIALERVFDQLAAKLGLAPLFATLMSKESAPSVGAKISRSLLKTILVIYTFSMFAIGAVFFNAPDISRAFTMLGQMFTLGKGMVSPQNGLILSLSFLLFGFNAVQMVKKWPRLEPVRAYALAGVYGFLVVMLLGRFAPGGGDFIYFQF